MITSFLGNGVLILPETGLLGVPFFVYSKDSSSSDFVLALFANSWTYFE